MANWTEETKLSVWGKCKTIPGKSEQDYRLDEQGAQIKWSDYGVTMECIQVMDGKLTIYIQNQCFKKWELIKKRSMMRLICEH